MLYMLYLLMRKLTKCVHFGRHSFSFQLSSIVCLQPLLLLQLVLCFLVATLPQATALTVSATNHQIHKRMSITDLRKVFQVDSHNDVPEYELINIRLINKRSVDQQRDKNDATLHKQIHLNPFGKQLKLNLKQNSDFNDRVKDMKVFLAETTSNGKLKYSEDPTTSLEKQYLGTTYHDKSNMAALLVDHNSDGNIQLHGTIGNELVIRPIPPSISLENNKYSNDDDDDEMFLDEDEAIELAKTQTHAAINSSTTNSTISAAFASSLPSNLSSKQLSKTATNYQKKLDNEKNAHIVYKRKLFNPDSHSDYLELEPGVSLIGSQGQNWTLFENSTSGVRHSRRTKRQAPDTVWPEVLLVVDYDSFVLHGATSRDVKRYFISFWNGVDLRYKLLSHPQIRVSLAGMIVAKDRDATPYLERNRLRAPNADAVDAAGALTDMGKYLYREDRLPTYDLAVVITKLDMCRRRYEGGRCNRGTAGFAYVGGACVVNKRLEKVNSVAIIEDSGGFSGIIVAAHEVGHLLGCVHDGSPPPSYLGGPGATRCPWEDGFIMSDLRHTERGFRWSSCSVEQFKHFLNGETATCLYNFPHENQLLPRVLPGTMLSLDDQCKRDRGTNACFKDARVCAQLFCFDSASGYCVSYRPAAEGSPCGDGQVCRNGKCITEIENIIPDYTHVTQTVVSRAQAPNSDRLLSRSDSPVSGRRQSRLRNRSGLARAATNNPYTKPELQQPLQQPPTQEVQAVQPVPAVQAVQPNTRAKVLCSNNVERMAGSLTCDQFLERFGDRYCKHDYIKRNCCASHANMCIGVV